MQDNNNATNESSQLLQLFQEMHEALLRLDDYFSSPGEDDWIRFSKEVLTPARAVLAKMNGEMYEQQ